METLYVLPILLFSVVVHEVAHGMMALRLGDPTARDMGRLTLNPVPHIDLIGSIAIPLLSILAAGQVFIAWAKPVPVNPLYFEDRRRGDILVSVVGPLSNLVMALVCALGYVVAIRLFGRTDAADGFSALVRGFIIHMLSAGVTLNVFLAVFNLIPVPPLDGSHVLASLLPDTAAAAYRQIGFFGILVVIMLMRVPFVRDILYGIVGLIQAPYILLIHQLLQV